MSWTRPHIGVIGAGAIGGITAALIKQAGCDVENVCKYENVARQTNEKGLHIKGFCGDHWVPMPAVAEIKDMKADKDLILLATKATDLVPAAQALLPLLTPDTLVVSLQNGICEETLGEVVGHERVIGCVVGWGATMNSPGELEMTSGGEFIIGTLDKRPEPRLQTIKEIFDQVVPCNISENILGSLYAKLIVNSCITSLGAICGLYMGQMLADRKIRNIFIDIMHEAMAVADAMDLHVETLGGRMNYYRFMAGSGTLAQLRRHLMIRLIGFKYRRLKSSSLQSLERGKPTEIDYLNGYITDKARKLNVPVPVNDKVVRVIKEIEAGNRRISPENFKTF
ncbi:MAG: ketopantoate reductase family protein [Desulfobacterales bacterium]